MKIMVLVATAARPPRWRMRPRLAAGRRWPTRSQQAALVEQVHCEVRLGAQALQTLHPWRPPEWRDRAGAVDRSRFERQGPVECRDELHQRQGSVDGHCSDRLDGDDKRDRSSRRIWSGFHKPRPDRLRLRGRSSGQSLRDVAHRRREHGRRRAARAARHGVRDRHPWRNYAPDGGGDSHTYSAAATFDFGYGGDVKLGLIDSQQSGFASGAFDPSSSMSSPTAPKFWMGLSELVDRRQLLSGSRHRSGLNLWAGRRFDVRLQSRR